ncbi:hypothetical protein AB4Y43_17030 [Paraburkholderia sp. BR10872]|uniref:hypothetical protein n=1 Tax=Paraburkholderia sp. BR10872 TaxID=3236989 RepID=UPI0034D22825
MPLEDVGSETGNNEQLREMVEQSGLTQVEALALINAGQAFPVALSTWKSYLAAPTSARRRNCPDAVLKRAKQTIGRLMK